MRVAVADVTHDRLAPTRQRPCYPLQRLLDTLPSSLYQLQKGLSGGFLIFTIEPYPQVLHPVDRFASLWKTPPPLVTRDQLVDIQLIGGLQPALAQLLEGFGFLVIELFLHRAQDLIQRTHGLLDHMEAIDHVHVVAEDCLDGGKERLGHIQDDDFNPIAFSLRAAVKPGDDILGLSTFEGRNGVSAVQVDNQRIVAVPLTPGLLIDPNSAAELARAAPTAPFKRPAKHRACGEAIATGQFVARTPPQAFRSDLVVEALRPFRPLPEGCTRFPGAMPACGALKTPQMQPQPDGMLQDGQVAEAPWAAFLHAGTACATLGTHNVLVSAFEMHIQLLGAEYLMDDTEFWETEQHFDTLEVHEHRFLLLAVRIASIVRGILCLSMSDTQPLAIDLRRWPQTWRRANLKKFRTE
jgi:hypothetical protein